MKNGNEEQSSLDCDVGLGLKMQVHPSSTEPYYSCKRANTTTMAFPLYHSDSNANVTGFSGDGHGGGGSILGQVAGIGIGGGMFVPEKGPFSGSQWQEFERQKIIQKYIMASVPVPPELLLPLSRTTTTSSLPPVSQSNIVSGLELRFGSGTGSDPEPWRCKRTDGKKWRCSRDVAPDQKYCERHAHKSRSRSRKPVEIPSSSHNKSNNTNYSHPGFIQLSTNCPPTKQPIQTPNSQFPTMASSTTTYDQTRCIEWFMRGGSGTSSNIPFSTCNQQQWQQQQLFQTSSKYSDNNKNVSLYQPHDGQYQDKGNFMSPDSYTLDNNNIIRHMLENHHQPDNGTTSLHDGMPSLNPKKAQKTRHFIDAWEKEGKKNSESSLTLSMYGHGGNEIDDEGINGNGNNLGINWMNSFGPGGPLGEALCLGNASTTRGNSNLASPHGYSSNNSSSGTGGSKSSGEDGSHALNFIG